MSADFQFSQFLFVALLSHWYQHLKHAEMQSETRGVQSFRAKYGASAETQ